VKGNPGGPICRKWNCDNTFTFSDNKERLHRADINDSGSLDEEGDGKIHAAMIQDLGTAEKRRVLKKKYPNPLLKHLPFRTKFTLDRYEGKLLHEWNSIRDSSWDMLYIGQLMVRPMAGFNFTTH